MRAQSAFPLWWLGMIFATLSGRSKEVDEAGGLSTIVLTADPWDDTTSLARTLGQLRPS
jgi:hypothetical protein